MAQCLEILQSTHSQTHEDRKVNMAQAVLLSGRFTSVWKYCKEQKPSHKDRKSNMAQYCLERQEVPFMFNNISAFQQATHSSNISCAHSLSY